MTKIPCHYILMSTQETGEEVRVGNKKFATHREAYVAMRFAEHKIPEEWGAIWIESVLDYPTFSEDDEYEDEDNPCCSSV